MKRGDKLLRTLIEQGGHIICPVCNNSFNWSYKFEQICPENFCNPNGIPTSTESTPHKHISHIATANGKIRFIITCKNCCSNIETDAMELINKNNYRSNKV